MLPTPEPISNWILFIIIRRVSNEVRDISSNILDITIPSFNVTRNLRNFSMVETLPTVM